MTSLRALAAAATVGLVLPALAACAADERQEEFAPEARPAAASEREPLVLGSVSDDPEEEAEVFQPFVDVLAERVADTGITHGEVVVLSTVEQMADRLRSGEVDLYLDSMLGVTSVVQDGTAVPVLRRWKGGVPTYSSIVVARRDSGVRTPADLVGRVVAFEEDTSTSGWFLPYTALRASGLELSEMAEPVEAVPAGQVGYRFTRDEENTVFQVLDGRVAAGALSEQDLAEHAGDRAGELVTVVRSMEVPRQGLVHRADLPADVVDAVTRTLTTLHETPEGRQALLDFEGTTRFDALTPQDLAPMVELRTSLADDPF